MVLVKIGVDKGIEIWGWDVFTELIFGKGGMDKIGIHVVIGELDVGKRGSCGVWDKFRNGSLIIFSNIFDSGGTNED